MIWLACSAACLGWGIHVCRNNKGLGWICVGFALLQLCILFAQAFLSHGVYESTWEPQLTTVCSGLRYNPLLRPDLDAMVEQLSAAEVEVAVDDQIYPNGRLCRVARP